MKKNRHIYQFIGRLVWGFLLICLKGFTFILLIGITLFIISLITYQFGFEGRLIDFGLLSLLFLILWGIEKRKIQETKKNLSTLISRYHLNNHIQNQLKTDKNKPILSGKIQDRNFKLFYKKNEGARFLNPSCFIFHYDCKTYIPKGFTLHKRQLNEIIMEKLSIINTVKTGGAFFDKRFLIESEDATFVEQLFSEDIKTALNLVYSDFKGKLRFKYGIIEYHQMGQLNTELKMGQFAYMIDTVTLLLNKLESKKMEAE